MEGREVEDFLILCLKTKIFSEEQVRALWTEYKRMYGRAHIAIHEELQKEFRELSKNWR
jgi:hypothetical protein